MDKREFYERISKALLLAEEKFFSKIHQTSTGPFGTGICSRVELRRVRQRRDAAISVFSIGEAIRRARREIAAADMWQFSCTSWNSARVEICTLPFIEFDTGRIASMRRILQVAAEFS